MSELTNLARPYAKAAFEFAVEHNALEAWTGMLFFRRATAKCRCS
jgi:F-type H+-transporting ATPase subunit delta